MGFQILTTVIRPYIMCIKVAPRNPHRMQCDRLTMQEHNWERMTVLSSHNRKCLNKEHQESSFIIYNKIINITFKITC